MYTAIIIPVDGVASLVNQLIIEIHACGDADNFYDEDSVNLIELQSLASKLLTNMLDPLFNVEDHELSVATTDTITLVFDRIVAWIENCPLKFSRLQWIFTVPNDEQHLMLLFRKGE